jgi:hypothetical protein
VSLRLILMPAIAASFLGSLSEPESALNLVTD